MSVPKVAIVGRPNVGKSSLLNWLTRKRISVVDSAAGVTRDRVTFVIEEQGRYFELIDTGGIGIVDVDDLSQEIEAQIDRGIADADLLLLVVDGKTGLVPLDRLVADRLRGLEKNVLLVVNKCDSPKQDLEIAEFFSLTNAPVVCTSVLGERNKDELIQAIVDNLPDPDALEQEDGEAQKAEPELKLAIVGRRNAGKSTFINALARTERMIVSEVAGTTRDSVDVRFQLDGKTFIAIDTPGVRKRKSLANDVEFYGLLRAKRSIRRADVVFLFFDATQTISKIDKQLVQEISEHYKPCIFVVNKWDLAQEQGMTTEKWTNYLFTSFASMRHVPIAYITAKDDKNTKQLINLAQTIAKQARIRVSTSEINQVVRAAMVNHPPPSRTGKRIKIYFGTQVSVEPPTIVLKCNHPEKVDKSWRRYLLGVLQKQLPFKEVPIKLYLRMRGAGSGQTALSVEDHADSADIVIDEEFAMNDEFLSDED